MSVDEYLDYLSGNLPDTTKFRKIDDLIYQLYDLRILEQRMGKWPQVNGLSFAVQVDDEEYLKEHQMKQREEIKKNNETKELDQKEVDEYRSIKTDLESQLLKINKLYRSLDQDRQINEQQIKSIFDCHFCYLHHKSDSRSFINTLKDKEYTIDDGIKNTKIEFYKTLVKWEDVRKKLFINERIKLQHNYTKKCKDYLEGPKSPAKLKKFLVDVFNYDGIPRAVNSKIPLPSINETILRVDVDGKIFVYDMHGEHATLYNIFEDVDCVTNPDLNFKDLPTGDPENVPK